MLDVWVCEGVTSCLQISQTRISRVHAPSVLFYVRTHAWFQAQVVCGLIDGVEKGCWMRAAGAYRHLSGSQVAS